jgi:hypothetical protein
VEEDDEEDVATRSVPPAKIVEIREDEEPVRRRSPTPAVEVAPEPTRVPVPTMPEHPYRNAKDATYAPPRSRNIGAPVKPIAANKPEAAYRNLPAIHDPSIATKVYNRALDTPVTITYHELLSLSPEVRSQIREATSSKRITKINAVPTTDTAMLEEHGITEEEMLYLFPGEEIVTSETATNIMLCDSDYRQINEGYVVEDDYDKYYRNLQPGEQPDPKRIIVAKESAALRSILPLVNNHLKVESILDAGSQIIAMSEEVCHELSLAYDPTVILNMQSANGGVDPSLGLARNVPFLIGPLTFYLQVHVIRQPAYDILLGRPFDCLTESIVKNFKNEDQTITIHDPNTRRIATIPTVPRGPPRILSKKKAVFHS